MLASNQEPSDASLSRHSAPPAYVVGRDAEGHWLAIETHGIAGGIFRTEAAAIRFAQDETFRSPGAVLSTTDLLALRI